jgi:hypothetical protein
MAHHVAYISAGLDSASIGKIVPICKEKSISWPFIRESEGDQEHVILRLALGFQLSRFVLRF